MGTFSHQVPTWPPEFAFSFSSSSFFLQVNPYVLHSPLLSSWLITKEDMCMYVYLYIHTYLHSLLPPLEFPKGRKFCLSCSLAHVSVPTPCRILGPQWTSVGWMNACGLIHSYWRWQMWSACWLSFLLFPPLTVGAMFAGVHLKVWVPGWRPTTTWVLILALPLPDVWPETSYFTTIKPFLLSSTHQSVCLPICPPIIIHTPKLPYFCYDHPSIQ